MKTAVVTGSTRGIGRAIAEALIARGINVVISAQDAADAAAVAGTLRKGDARAIGVACDIRSEVALSGLWDAAVAEFGGVDIWINNAGLALSGPSGLTIPPDDMRLMLDINVMGTLLGCQVAMRGMIAAGKSGAIYNVLGAGTDGRVVPRMIGYATSKAATTFFTRSLAAEAEGSAVLVAGLSPGLVITEGFLREHAKSPPETRAAREAVVNLIGDHPETIGRWAARIIDSNDRNGRIFTWLSADKIRRRRRGKPRNILGRYDDRAG